MYDRAVEIDEAIAAGHRALDALAEAADSLDSAKRWGIVDILGGGLITASELAAGCVLNLGLGLSIWDYSALPFQLSQA